LIYNINYYSNSYIAKIGYLVGANKVIVRNTLKEKRKSNYVSKYYPKYNKEFTFEARAKSLEFIKLKLK
jgi:hypothetical protein